MKQFVVFIVSLSLLVGCTTNTSYVHSLEADNARLKQEVEVGAARLDEVRAEASKDATTCEKAMAGMREMEASVVQSAKDAYASGKPALEDAIKSAYEAGKPVVVQAGKDGAAWVKKTIKDEAREIAK